jgi:hypothetical protein
MSGPLRNAMHEVFAQAIFQRPKTGLTLAQCYMQSGFKARGHSADELGSRLAQAPEIRDRVAELQDAVAREAVITVESICVELDEAVQVASENRQAAAMISATTLRAKLAGLLRDKVEVTNRDAFSGCETMAEVADQLLRLTNPEIRITDKKRQMMLDELERHAAAITDIAMGADDTVRDPADGEQHPPPVNLRVSKGNSIVRQRKNW